MICLGGTSFWLFDNPLRAIGLFVIALGLILTSFCLKKKHEKTKAINQEFHEFNSPFFTPIISF